MPFEQFRRWNRLVGEEFLLQGDLEKVEFGHLISPPAGFDRDVSKGAVVHGFTRFFMRYLSLPLFEKLNELSQVGEFPAAQSDASTLPSVEGNRGSGAATLRSSGGLRLFERKNADRSSGCCFCQSLMECAASSSHLPFILRPINAPSRPPLYSLD